jgi:hypothetical protein
MSGIEGIIVNDGVFKFKLQFYYGDIKIKKNVIKHFKLNKSE